MTTAGASARTPLIDLAQVIRSKNAGPFTLTLDVMFDDPEVFERVVNSGALSQETIARLYRVPVESVAIISFPLAKAIKMTMPRGVGSGDATDTDVYATQQHVPLYDIDIPA